MRPIVKTSRKKISKHYKRHSALKGRCSMQMLPGRGVNVIKLRYQLLTGAVQMFARHGLKPMASIVRTG
jgi:hypothetical protein